MIDNQAFSALDLLRCVNGRITSYLAIFEPRMLRPQRNTTPFEQGIEDTETRPRTTGEGIKAQHLLRGSNLYSSILPYIIFDASLVFVGKSGDLIALDSKLTRHHGHRYDTLSLNQFFYSRGNLYMFVKLYGSVAHLFNHIRNCGCSCCWRCRSSCVLKRKVSYCKRCLNYTKTQAGAKGS